MKNALLIAARNEALKVMRKISQKRFADKKRNEAKKRRKAARNQIALNKARASGLLRGFKNAFGNFGNDPGRFLQLVQAHNHSVRYKSVDPYGLLSPAERHRINAERLAEHLTNPNAVRIVHNYLIEKQIQARHNAHVAAVQRARNEAERVLIAANAELRRLSMTVPR
ncbi:hypothetical protein EBT25_01460 [bacterium]|nr:hypothetical protein [bacterium]